jgi:hypothetical protein
MKPFGLSLCALASLSALCLPGAAQTTTPQSNPWNGSWQLDRSSLKYDGPTYTVATDADGYTITRGGKTMPKMVCNGQPNAPNDGVVTTCTKTDNGYNLVNTRDGKPVSTVKIERSSDGSTVTRAATITPPDGSSPFTITTVNKRVSQSTTASGDPVTYKEVSFTESQDTGVLTVQVNADSVDFKETDNDKPVNCKLDGTPTSVGGTRTMSCKLADPHTLKVTYSNNGKVARENTFVLSEDGQSIQETDVTPDPMPSTMTVTLHKS